MTLLSIYYFIYLEVYNSTINFVKAYPFIASLGLY
jgi:hypothetical protein